MRYFPVEDSPFRFTMGLKPVRGQSWLDIDDHYVADTKLKSDLTQNQREDVFFTSPAAKAAEEEVFNLVHRELGSAYPDVQIPTPDTDNPLLSASLMVQEDLVIMQANGSGDFDLTSASVCFPTGWDLREKAGRPMAFIHAPVPGLNPAIGPSIQKFFQNMKPGKIVERFNWGLTDQAALFQPRWWRAQQPPQTAIDFSNIGERIFFRVERQTLQRLQTPESALFTIRIFCHPLKELVSDPSRRERLMNALGTMPDALRRYKTVAQYEELLFRYLRGG